MKRSVQIYVTAVVAACIAAMAAVAFLAPPPSGEDWTASSFFALLGLLAILLSYQRSGGTASGSVSFLPFLSGILVAPTGAAASTIVAATFAANIIARRPPSKTFFNSAQFGIAAAVATLILAPIGPLTRDGLSSIHVVLFTAAAMAFILINITLVVGVISLADGRRYFPTWRRILSATLLYDVLAFPIIALLAWSYTTLGMGWLLAIVLPLLGLRQLYKQNAELEKSTEELLQLMVAAIEARDPYTSGHSRRVASYSRIIARAAKLSPKEVERIGVAALLHDVGKIYEIYAPILRKAGPLTDDERDSINTHPIKSAELVEKVSQLRNLVPTVRAHHERWDGRGYPDRLAEFAIPIGARVIAIADTIDAMRTTRPYRDAISIDVIKEEVRISSGRQFDPDLVDATLVDAAWARLVRAMQRFEKLNPGEDLTFEEIEAIELSAEGRGATSALKG